MIQLLTIRNFQSLTDVTLDLAPLTVIVGQSSSGKSALIRALQALIRNRRGTEFITHGERTASISATFATSDSRHSGIVTLTRSTQAAPNSYTIIPLDPAHPLGPKSEFTKLGGDIPGPVSEFIGIPTQQAAVTIASQFDPPYLLSASPTEAARIFGTLTNASVLLDGARESNRRKLQASQTLRIRAQDLAAIQQRVPEFQALRAQSQALDNADTLITRARTLASRLSALSALTDTVTIAQDRIPALTARLGSLSDPQALTALLDSRDAPYARLALFQAHVASLRTASNALKQARDNDTLAQTAVTSATADLAQAMTGITLGFESYFLEHGAVQHVTPGFALIQVSEAAKLATEYVSALDT